MDLAVEEVTAFLAQKGVPLDDELIQRRRTCAVWPFTSTGTPTP
jgi:hypothetical protein